ncbi:Globin family protein [Dirofilaria immitis]|nr:Globin family protein [Dirofilaria immitis]
MSHSEVKARCMKAMNESGRVGSDDAAIQHGLNFYKYLFEHQPSVRVYFKGAENFRQRLMLSVRILIDTYDDSETFKAYSREIVNRHIKFKMDRTLWVKFFTLFISNLKEHTTVDEETEKLSSKLAKNFLMNVSNILLR